MDELAFYDVGCDAPRGPRRAVILARRGVRRVLRPIFVRLAEILRGLAARLDAAEAADAALRGEVEALGRKADDLADRVQTALAFGWDYAALARRLATLEDRVEALSSASDGARASVPFPTEIRAEAG